MKNTYNTSVLNSIVIVAALGYFVDIYDLVLFSIVRVSSLKSLGFSGAALLDHGVFLINMQMFGMLIGGILWGVLGDKKGRLSVLFGSILLYSVANIANAFVHTIPAYAFWRTLAGIGLAGELGAGITLVAETLPKEKRGYGTMLVAAVGVSGAIFAGLIAKYFSWRTNFIIGGGLGLSLLVLRISMYESGLFKRSVKSNISRGNFFKLFTKRDLFFKYLKCILIGMPNWFVIGILITFSPELAQALGTTGPVHAATAIMVSYAGLVVGDVASGVISQLLASRKKTMLLFLLGSSAMVALNMVVFGLTPQLYYVLCFMLGLSCGYWAIFVTIAAEQFGTNLRATVATTVPNFVRGALVPISLAFMALKPSLGVVHAAAWVGGICLVIALCAAVYLEETHGKDLDYFEVI
ncbi:MAG: MFS transporter [Candidatus Margulisiibacteriota bacterium]